MGARRINLKGEFITHKVFGRGQVVEHGDDFVTVMFAKAEDMKKFVYPAAIGIFLELENAETSKGFKEYSDEMALNNASAQTAAAERVVAEKLAAQERAKALKKAMKKPAKKVSKPV